MINTITVYELVIVKVFCDYFVIKHEFDEYLIYFPRMPYFPFQS